MKLYRNTNLDAVFGMITVFSPYESIMQIKEIRIEASQVLDLISDNEIALNLTLKLQEVPSFGMFFHVMETIHFIHVCVR